MDNKIYDKPKLSDRSKQIGNAIYRRLRERRYTKEELQDEFSVNERIVRDLISEIAKKRPIISTSTQKGYKAPNFTPEDGLEVIHQIRELESRAAEILSRCPPLMDYIEQYQKKLGAVTLAEFERKLQGGE